MIDERMVAEKNRLLDPADLELLKQILEEYHVEKAWDEALEADGYFFEKGGPGSGIKGHTTYRGRHPKRNKVDSIHKIDVQKYIENLTAEEKQQLKDMMIAKMYKDEKTREDIVRWLHIVKKGDTSKSIYKTEDGTYTKERTAIHEKIMGEFYKDIPAKGKPTVAFFGGLPGSGKGSLKKYVPDSDNYTYINNDDIKERLPEYDGHNSPFVHDEAGDIVVELQKRVLAIRGNLIIDGTMKNKEKGEALVKKYREAGYAIMYFGTNCPAKEAANRVCSRFEETDRLVPPEVFIGAVDSTNINQFELLKKADKGEIFDTNVPKGSPFKRIARKGIVVR